MINSFNIAIDYSNLKQCSFMELIEFTKKYKNFHQEVIWDCSIQKTIYCNSHELIAVLEYDNHNYQFTSYIRNTE